MWYVTFAGFDVLKYEHCQFGNAERKHSLFSIISYIFFSRVENAKMEMLYIFCAFSYMGSKLVNNPRVLFIPILYSSNKKRIVETVVSTCFMYEMNNTFSNLAPFVSFEYFLNFSMRGKT